MGLGQERAPLWVQTERQAGSAYSFSTVPRARDAFRGPWKYFNFFENQKKKMTLMIMNLAQDYSHLYTNGVVKISFSIYIYILMKGPTDKDAWHPWRPWYSSRCCSSSHLIGSGWSDGVRWSMVDWGIIYSIWWVSPGESERRSLGCCVKAMPSSAKSYFPSEKELEA